MNSKVISEYKAASAKYNRLMEVFPDVTENTESTLRLIHKTHKLTEVNINVSAIAKCTVGKMDFYTFSNPLFEKLFEHAVTFPITLKHGNLKYIQFRTLSSIVEQYVETGTYDYEVILKKIFEKEERTAAEDKLSKEAETIRGDLIRKGRLLIDPKYHEFFTEFPIDKEGYHVVG